MNELSFFDNKINSRILDLHTAYLGRVERINGDKAIVKPLTKYKAYGGNSAEQSVAPAFIPSNIKYTTETITIDGAEKTVLVPDDLSVGDIVFVGVCDRDITYARYGEISEPKSKRHHNINDGVILRVL